jgi:hypothetical protein
MLTIGKIFEESLIFSIMNLKLFVLIGKVEPLLASMRRAAYFKLLVVHAMGGKNKNTIRSTTKPNPVLT